MSAVRPSTQPPSESPWPLMYLVMLWISRSAPWLRGRMQMGPAKVASTLSSAPALCAMSAMASMSLMPVVGLPGVSTWMSLVLGRTAARTASVSVVSSSVDAAPVHRRAVGGNAVVGGHIDRLVNGAEAVVLPSAAVYGGGVDVQLSFHGDALLSIIIRRRRPHRSCCLHCSAGG